MGIRDIIKQAGGTMKVATALKINETAVIQWQNRKQIPKKYWEFFLDRNICTLDQLFKLGRRRA